MDLQNVDLHVCDAADPHDRLGFITDWVTSWGYAVESTKHVHRTVVGGGLQTKGV
jgi:hypothetical protein